jgi:hypothetical protein
MTNVAHYYYTKTNLGDIKRAADIFNEYAEENNEMSESLVNMRYTVWAGNEVFKRNTANDYDKKFYSYSLQVNIL